MIGCERHDFRNSHPSWALVFRRYFVRNIALRYDSRQPAVGFEHTNRSYLLFAQITRSVVDSRFLTDRVDFSSATGSNLRLSCEPPTYLSLSPS